MSYKPDALPTGDEFHAYVLNEFKKIAAEFLAIQPAPVPNPDVLWKWDATAVAPFGIQAKPAAEWGANQRVMFLENIGGRNAVRLLTMPGDSNLYGSGTSERCDLQLSQANTDGYEGHEAWWAHSVWFPDDYEDPLPSPASAQPWNWGVVFDFHNTIAGTGQANFQVEAMPVTGSDSGRPTGLTFKMAWGSQAGPTEKRYPISPVSRNGWYDFKYHVRWTSDTTGFLDAWVNGAKKMAYRGPTLYQSQGVFCKLANYHSPHGKPSAVLHGPIVRARTEAGLA